MHDVRANLHIGNAAKYHLMLHSTLRSVSYTMREQLKLETPWTRRFHQRARASPWKHRGVIRTGRCERSILVMSFFGASRGASDLHKLRAKILGGFRTPSRRSTSVGDVLASLRSVHFIKVLNLSRLEHRGMLRPLLNGRNTKFEAVNPITDNPPPLHNTLRRTTRPADETRLSPLKCSST